MDDLADGDAVVAGELVVALVMRRHRHHRAVAVFHQHEIGRPDRHRLAADRVQRLQAGIDAAFFQGGHVRLGHTGIAAGVDEFPQCGIARRRLVGQRMLGRHRHEGHAHHGVRTGGIDRQGIDTAGETELHLDALGTADPVALHGAHLLRPALQGVQAGEQFLGVVGDLQEPLRDLAPFHRRPGTPPPAVDDLFVGQHGLVDGVPVHHSGLLVDQALLEQAGKEPLLPAIIVRIAGRKLALPVIAEAKLPELVAHVVDVFTGPPGRRHAVLDGGVLGRQAEGVPAHGLQDIAALHALVAGDHVADGVVAHMPHVQPPAGIGEHGEAVVFFPPRILGDPEGPVRFPILPGLGLDFLRSVDDIHTGHLQGHDRGGRIP